jgi:uncharacterized membrane protein
MVLKDMFNREKIRKEHWIFGVVAVFAIVGLLASLVLSIEKIQLAEHPDAALPCSLNAFLNCATVMNTPEASLFGFPNSFIGMMAYAMLLTVAVAYLLGAKLPKSFMTLAQIGVTVEIIFAYWLFFDSVFAIRVLCPFCLLVTFSSTMIFAAITRYNILEKNLGFAPKTQAALDKLMDKDYDKFAVAAWVMAMVALVLVRFPGIFSS